MGDLAADPASLSAVLSMLSANDTNAIRQGEKLLKRLMKHGAGAIAMLQQLQDTTNVANRLQAALILKRRLGSLASKLSEAEVQILKVQLINFLKTEPLKPVSVAIAGAISAFAKVIYDAGSAWPELFSLMMELAQSPNEGWRTLNYSLAEQLAEHIPDQLRPHTKTLAQMFTLGCQDAVPAVSVAAMKATTSYISAFADEPDVMEMQCVLTPVLTVLQACLQRGDEETVSEGLDIFQECILTEQPIINDHIEMLVPFVVAILQNEGFDSAVKQSAGATLMNIVESRPKLVAKKGMVMPVLSALAMIIAKADASAAGSLFSFAEQEGRLDQDDDDDEDEDYSPEMDIQRMAQSCVDTMAIHIPSKYFVEPALLICSQGMQSADPQMRKAGCALLGVISEGCSDALRQQLNQTVPALLASAADPEFYVRECACFALGQFSEHCQPEILHFHSTVIPTMLQCLEDPRHTVQGTACYVLEMFLENLQPETLRPFLNPLLTRLAALLQSSTKQITQEMALSAISATAVAAEIEFLPFAEGVCSFLAQKLFLTEPKDLTVRGRSLECLGHVAIAIGPEHFARYFEAGMQSAVQGIQLEDDDLKEHSYVFFANASKVMGAAFGPFLAQLVPHLRGVIIENEIVDVDDEEDEDAEGDEEDDEDDDESGLKLKAHTGFINTKKAALTALGSLAEHTKECFFPYLEEIMKSVFAEPCTSYHEAIRGEAHGILHTFVTCACAANGVPKPAPGQVLELPGVVGAVCRISLATAIKAITEDPDKPPVSLALESISSILQSVGSAALTIPAADDAPTTLGQVLMENIVKLLKEEAPCQAKLENPEEGDEDDHDSLVMDSVSDLIGTLAKCVGPSFEGYFDGLLPLLMRFVDPRRVHTDRSMAVGCFAEVVAEIGPASIKYVSTFLPIIQQSLSDSMESVRRNGAFCLGVLVQSTGRELVSHFPTMLQWLHPLCTRPPTQQGSDVGGADVDNAISAVARMINAAPDAVPLPVVLPAMLAALPLRADGIEGPNIYACLAQLVVTANPAAISSLPQILLAFAQALVPGSKINVDPESRGPVVGSLKMLVANEGARAAVTAAMALIEDATLKQVLVEAVAA